MSMLSIMKQVDRRLLSCLQQNPVYMNNILSILNSSKQGLAAVIDWLIESCLLLPVFLFFNGDTIDIQHWVSLRCIA